MYTLFVTRGYPTKKYKTYGIFEFDQAKALVEQGLKVVYIALDLRSIRRWRKWGIQREKLNGIDVFSFSIPLGRVSKKILEYFYIKGLMKIYTIIEKEHGRPSIIHAHFFQFGYFSTILKNKFNIPLIVTEHSEVVNREVIDKYTKNIATITYESSDKVIAVSPHLQRRIMKNFGIDSVYIPNMVDLRVFNFSQKTSEAKFFDFVSTGHLIKSKRMDLTIIAFLKAFEFEKNVRLTIFGHGVEKKNLQKLIVDLNLESRVFLEGQTSREKISSKLNDSDCFVLASQTETFGVAYIEALATGTPVIATKSGGPETFVDKTNGLLIDVDNEQQLVESMRYMYNNIGYYNREKIANETKNKFSPAVVAEQIIQLYDFVISLNESLNEGN